MWSYQSYATLYDRGWISVWISGHRGKLVLVAHECASIIEVHALVSIVPFDRSGGAVASSYGGAWTFDVLYRVRSVQDVEVVFAGPVGSHADAQIPSTFVYESQQPGQVFSQEIIKAVCVPDAARKSHHVHIVKKLFFNLVSGKNLELVVRAQGLHDPVGALYRGLGLVYENCYTPSHDCSTRKMVLSIAWRMGTAP